MTSTLRQTVYPRLNTFLRNVTGGRAYAAYTLSQEEFIAHLPDTQGGMETVESFLFQEGFRRVKVLAALKYHPDTGDPDNGSWRVVDDENPRHQYHIHVFEVSDGIDVFCHYEYRPDLKPVANESVTDMVDRLKDHYKPESDEYLMGKYPPSLNSMFTHGPFWRGKK